MVEFDEGIVSMSFVFMHYRAHRMLQKLKFVPPDEVNAFHGFKFIVLYNRDIVSMIKDAISKTLSF